MTDQAARARYSNVAIILHWIIAVLILYNLVSGLLVETLPSRFFAFHVSSGITILLLTVVRIVWRLTHRPPPYLPMRRIEKILARIVHFSIYGAMLAAPLTGWAMLSTHIEPERPGMAITPVQLAKPDSALSIWGLFELPKFEPIARLATLPDHQAALRRTRDRYIDLHEEIGWIFLGLLILHVSGALKHQLIDRQQQLARMGLGRAKPSG